MSALPLPALPKFISASDPAALFVEFFLGDRKGACVVSEASTEQSSRPSCLFSGRQHPSPLSQPPSLPYPVPQKSAWAPRAPSDTGAQSTVLRLPYS